MIYHFCAQYADPDTGIVTFLDGVMTSDHPITTSEHYGAAKKAIHPDDHERLTILTLTPLPEEVRGSIH